MFQLLTNLYLLHAGKQEVASTRIVMPYNFLLLEMSKLKTFWKAQTSMVRDKKQLLRSSQVLRSEQDDGQCISNSRMLFPHKKSLTLLQWVDKKSIFSTNIKQNVPRVKLSDIPNSSALESKISWHYFRFSSKEEKTLWKQLMKRLRKIQIRVLIHNPIET